ncbi:tudor domain-containing protein 10 isoform X1 [Gopherus flavomarginatus]|uniref:tudor domain-containing protein 10 isoform X1 n=1 Tax=Gopherus flavomarginatus TaxID=286002 RepID=UPI0021CC1F2F|nr:tudor domain-containing protein 10 isoform X1 [Gopherus flavomarginatus]XP_050786771.1 tudor domain-containing protein 10 isoform X1 [Gopherus flavomarginatus]XP_050786773.1 tudor domain-containing protein 10 isoform X1 [Gopherus flavomarginatus]XP_050786774.1 tudor domain-containing protein 10 isoform X1 [Gopherus flavomarginatus]
MASSSGGWGAPKSHKPNGKPQQLKYSGVVKKKDSEVYVGNVPPEMTEEDILLLLRDFHPQHIKRCHSGLRSYAFVDLSSSEQVQAAIQRFNGHLVNGRRLFLSRTGADNGRKAPAETQSTMEMPALERVPRGELGLSHAKAETQTLQPAPPDAARQICYAVPMEMRGSFLALMLKDCFQDLNWLVSIAKLHGEAGLLVTDALPQTPYFWAIHLTEESHSNMHKLFCQLAEEESKQPYLTRQAVQRGTRCMAECILGEDGAAWNRCWVLEKVEDLAVVLFVDFGRSATVPLNSLRKLDEDDFWDIKPLAQPFMFQKEIVSARPMVRQILRGKVVGPSRLEPHILTFTFCTEEEEEAEDQ